MQKYHSVPVKDPTRVPHCYEKRGYYVMNEKMMCEKRAMYEKRANNVNCVRRCRSYENCENYENYAMSVNDALQRPLG